MKPDREATCDWNCTRPFPHDGPCSSQPSATVDEAREALESRIDEIRNGELVVLNVGEPTTDSLVDALIAAVRAHAEAAYANELERQTVMTQNIIAAVHQREAGASEGQCACGHPVFDHAQYRWSCFVRDCACEEFRVGSGNQAAPEHADATRRRAAQESFSDPVRQGEPPQTWHKEIAEEAMLALSYGAGNAIEQKEAALRKIYSLALPAPPAPEEGT